MGIRQRVVRQTITEYVCDLCKQAISDGQARTGSLTLRSPGQRGRPAETQVAFHIACASKITDSAQRPGRKPAAKTSAAPKKRGRPAAAKKATKRPPAKRKK